MRSLIALLPAVGCIGGMWLCMRMMSGGKKSSQSATADQAAGEKASASEVSELRGEISRLRAELHLRDQEPSQ